MGLHSYVQVGQELPRIDEESEYSDSDVSDADGSALLEAGFGGTSQLRPPAPVDSAAGVLRAPVATADAGSFRVFRRLGRGTGSGAGGADDDGQRLLGAGDAIGDADWYGDAAYAGGGDGEGGDAATPSDVGDDSDDASGGSDDDDDQSGDEGSDDESGGGSDDDASEGSDDDLVLTEDDYAALRDAGTTVADLATDVMHTVSQGRRGRSDVVCAVGGLTMLRDR